MVKVLDILESGRAALPRHDVNGFALSHPVQSARKLFHAEVSYRAEQPHTASHVRFGYERQHNVTHDGNTRTLGGTSAREALFSGKLCDVGTTLLLRLCNSDGAIFCLLSIRLGRSIGFRREDHA
jgi:hypothetical protein